MTPGPSGIPGVALAFGLVGSVGLPASVEPAPEDVSPGVLGFLVTLAVVLACIPLFRSMTGKIRGVEFRDAQNRTDPDAPDAVTSPSVTSPSVTSPKDSPQAPAQDLPPDDPPRDPPPARP